MSPYPVESSTFECLFGDGHDLSECRVKLLLCVRLNLSVSGVGVSVGGRSAHIGVTARAPGFVGHIKKDPNPPIAPGPQSPFASLAQSPADFA